MRKLVAKFAKDEHNFIQRKSVKCFLCDKGVFPTEVTKISDKIKLVNLM